MHLPKYTHQKFITLEAYVKINGSQSNEDEVSVLPPTRVRQAVAIIGELHRCFDTPST